MTVEAVESKNANLIIKIKYQKEMSICYFNFMEVFYNFGFFLSWILNVYIFSGIEGNGESQVFSAYADIYFMALFIPLLSISGIILSNIFKII